MATFRKLFLAPGALALLILSCGRSICAADEPAAQASRTTLRLAISNLDRSGRAVPTLRLARELMRQAVLIAARDGLGLSTRDASLREDVAAADGEPVLDLKMVTAKEGKSVLITLVRAGAKDNVKPFFETRYAYGGGSYDPFEYHELTALAEQASRTGLVEGLKKAGWAGEPNRADPDVRPPEQITQWLSEMNFFSQFAAVRQLHDLQKTEGESIHTLAALVRGYAHLSALTRFHWSAAHKVFLARSLLYADRLMNLDSQSAFALRHRAYVYGLCGLHERALADLNAANDAPQADTAHFAWESLIDKLCRFDFAGLQKEPPPPECLELGAFLAYRTVENSQSENLMITTGRDALSLSPENYDICDSLCRYHAVGLQHQMTKYGPTTFRETLPTRLQSMPAIPDSITDELQAQAQRPVEDHTDPAWAFGPSRMVLVNALVAAGAAGKDQSEPSWQTLGRLIEDVTFSHIYRRVVFCNDIWGLPRAQYHAQYQMAFAAVPDHPFLPLLRCAILERGSESDEIAKELKKVPLFDVDVPQLHPVAELFTVKNGNKLWAALLRHYDEVAYELEMVSEYSPEDRAVPFVERKVSRHSPEALARLIVVDPKYSAPYLENWERDHPDQAALLRELSTYYYHKKEWEPARRCLQRYIELSPDQSSYAMLAEAYWQEKDETKWRETLLASLEEEDAGLSHAHTHIKLAFDALRHKQPDKAVEYAEQAAGTGAAFAMMDAAKVHEALEHWERAEELMRENSQRYSNQQMEWYFWCRRTGRGSVEAAQAAALARVEQLRAKPSPWDRVSIAAYYLIADDRQAAYEILKPGGTDDRRMVVAEFNRVLLAHEFGDVQTRSNSLGKIIAQEKRPPEKRVAEIVPFIALAKWLDAGYEQPTDAKISTAEVEEIRKAAVSGQRANIDYYVGRFFYDRKDYELARQYFQQCVKASGPQLINGILASSHLRELPELKSPPADQKAEQNEADEASR